MKRFITTIAITVFTGFMLLGQYETNYSQLIMRAEEAYEARDFKTSVEFYEKAFEMNSDLASDLYNGACSAAMCGDTLKAFKLLNLSADCGFKNVEHINKDCDLYGLRHLASWEKVINKVTENRDNYLSADKVLKSVIAFVQTNQPDALWDMGSEVFRNTKDRDSINDLVNSLYQLLHKYKQSFQDLSKSQSFVTNYSKTNLNYASWEKNEKNNYEYVLTPNILGRSTKDFFRSSIGFSISVELISQGNNWALNNLQMHHKYFADSFNCNNYIKAYFSDSSSITCRTGIFGKNKEMVCLSTDKANNLNFARSFKTLEWQEFCDVPIAGDTVVYSANFVKKVNLPKRKTDNSFNDFFTPTSSYETLEIVFPDRNDYVIVSDGTFYGIYRGNFTTLKSWIVKAFNTPE